MESPTYPNRLLSSAFVNIIFTLVHRSSISNPTYKPHNPIQHMQAFPTSVSPPNTKPFHLTHVPPCLSMGFPREATDYANCIDVTSLTYHSPSMAMPCEYIPHKHTIPAPFLLQYHSTVAIPLFPIFPRNTPCEPHPTVSPPVSLPKWKCASCVGDMEKPHISKMDSRSRIYLGGVPRVTVAETAKVLRLPAILLRITLHACFLLC